jgi:DNA (cytosine-5)-methyltransferase 1
MRPRLLDLFCGAGGAAKGYADAGFEVVGVDIKPQPNFPFEFIQDDALGYLSRWGPARPWPWRQFDAIHASPPCQAYSVANNIHGRDDHPDLIDATRELLLATGLPYVIENVPGAPLRNPYTICGLTLGLNVKRHRLFETNFPMMVYPCHSSHAGDWLLVFGHTVLERGHEIGRTEKNGPRIRRKHTTTERGREAMGIDWMTRDELSQAIPPAYTEHIGSYLLTHLQTEQKAAA